MSESLPSRHQYIRLSGMPRERGLAYGRAARERIHRVAAEYRVLFDKEAHMSWDEAYRRARVYADPCLPS